MSPTKTSKLILKLRVVLLGGLVAVLVVGWGEFATSIVVPALQRSYWPAPASWVAARLAWEGHPELIYAERSVFYRESARLGAGRDYFEANVPTTLLPYLPLAPLRIDEARNVWLIFSLIIFFIAWLSLLNSLNVTLPWALALSALLTQFSPFRDDIGRGQAYTALFSLSVIGTLMTRDATGILYKLLSKGKYLTHLLAGVVFGFVAILKFYYGGVLLLPALVRRQYTLLLSAVVVFGAGTLLTILWWGLEPWAIAIPSSLTFRERAVTAVDFNQSLNGLLMHLLHYDAELNPTPVANLPNLVGPLWWGLVLSTLGVSLYALWRASNAKRSGYAHASTPAWELLPPALAIPLALLLAPLCDEYHFVLVLFPLLIVGLVLWEGMKPTRSDPSKSNSVSRQGLVAWATLGAATLLLAAPWPYRAPSMPGWQDLLHYPRLYGNMLLFGLMIVLLLWPPHKEVTS